MEKLESKEVEKKLATNIYREWPGEVAQCLGALVTFPKGLGLVPSGSVEYPKSL